MTFLDFFSGIGGFRLGMEMAGHTCLGHCEIDKYANKSYVAMHSPREDEWFANDITAVRPDELPEADCYCGGFPCQAFSIAGKRGGFDDTRGTLFFEVMRLARERKPKYLFLENVKGLLSHDGGVTFGTILRSLWECGYDAEWQVCNSKDFGVPQNRERVFIVGYLRGQCARQVFPIGESNDNAAENLSSGKGIAYCIDANYSKGTNTLEKSRRTQIAVPVLTPDRPEKRQNGRRFKDDGEEMFTLTAQDRRGAAIYDEPKLVGGVGDINFGKQYRQGNRIYDSEAVAMCLTSQPTGNAGGNSYLYKVGMRIRKLTPLECFRLQGFPDEYFYRAQAVNSDSQLYKEAGNSVTVNVIYAIAKRM